LLTFVGVLELGLGGEVRVVVLVTVLVGVGVGVVGLVVFFGLVCWVGRGRAEDIIS